jgi:hypothetical protein
MDPAHYFGTKQPMIFVYYNTPLYAYLEKIISFAVVSYIALFYSAAITLQVTWDRGHAKADHKRFSLART